MLIDPGHRLGDSWFIVAPDDVVHCYYLVCNDDVERHTAWDIAHATSTDLVNWELHGIVLDRGADDDWDGGCLATGSVIDDGSGGYLMAYTARWNERSVATGLATSPDLFNWTKHPANPATTPGPPYQVDRPWRDRPPTHWRDPFLVRSADGELQQLICASRPERQEDCSGTVATVTLVDDEWRRTDPIELEPVARELECPQIHEIDGGWFLVFSAFEALFSEHVQATDGETLGHGSYTMVADRPEGPYRFVQRSCIIPADHPQQPYACQVVTIRGRGYLIGTVWNDDGPDYLSDPVRISRVDDLLEVVALNGDAAIDAGNSTTDQTNERT